MPLNKSNQDTYTRRLIKSYGGSEIDFRFFLKLYWSSFLDLSLKGSVYTISWVSLLIIAAIFSHPFFLAFAVFVLFLGPIIPLMQILESLRKK